MNEFKDSNKKDYYKDAKEYSNEEIESAYDIAKTIITNKQWLVGEYKDWWKASYRLALFGDRGCNLYMQLCQNSPRYDEKSCKYQWKYAMKATENGKNKFSLTWFFNKVKSAAVRSKCSGLFD